MARNFSLEILLNSKSTLKVFGGLTLGKYSFTAKQAFSRLADGSEPLSYCIQNL